MTKTYRQYYEIDWASEYGCYAINRDSRLAENCSDAEGLVVEYFRGMDENEVSDRLADRLSLGLDYDYTLYDKQMHLVGFAYYLG